MKKRFDIKAIVTPQPVLITSMYDKNGNPNAMNVARGGLCKPRHIALFYTFVILMSLTSFAWGKDSIDAVTMESYEQGWLDRYGTLALKNNTNSTIHNVTYQITYLDMSGKPLDYEVYTTEVEIAPGMTRQIDIPAYEHERNFSYYKSESSSANPHKFKVKYELKGYNQDVKGSATTNGKDLNEDHTWAYVALLIVAIIFVVGLCIGLYVLVAVMAKKRNRSQVLWVLVALFTTPFLAMIMLLCIGKSYNSSTIIE